MQSPWCRWSPRRTFAPRLSSMGCGSRITRLASNSYALGMHRLLWFCLALALRAQTGLVNPGFDGKVGEPPAGWHTYNPPSMAFQVILTGQDCKSGKLCAAMTAEKAGGPREFGNLMQQVNAAPYRGKRDR